MKRANISKKALFIARAGIIAAMYVVLTLVSAALGLSSGVIQCRFSEALCILPVFTTAAIPGVTVGCIIANLITTGSIYDLLLGSFATLVGAVGAYLMRGRIIRYFSSIPTVIANMIAVPIILKLMNVPDVAFFYTALTVGAGEVISCTVLGLVLMIIIERSKLDKKLFSQR